MTQIGDSSEVAPGTRFGQFRVVSLLGRGGMGTTYLARDDSGRDLVVKTIRTDLAADPAFRARFRREAQAARLFRSALVARVWAFDCEADLPWIALERIDGPTLNEVVDNEGPLSHERLVGFAADLADAVHAFFDQGLAHGDLTPSNVVLQDGERLKILDLGLTRPTVDEAVTSEGPVFGTPYWEAPEVSAGFHPDSASDVNQWAKLVLFAGSGYPRRRRPLREALDQLPQPLRDQVERCLQPVPDARLDPQELWRVTRRRSTGSLDGRPHQPDPAADATTVAPILARTRRIEPSPPLREPPHPGPPSIKPTRTSTPVQRRWLRPAAVVAAATVAAALIAGGVIVLASRGTHHARWTGDAFTGTAIDQRRWSVELESDAAVSEHAGAVFTLRSGPPSGAVSAMLSSLCGFTGDFDVEVGYRLDTWPAASGARVGLLAESEAVERISDPGGEFYAGQSGITLSVLPTTDAAGYLRLVRSGTTLFGYARRQVTDPWQQVFTVPNEGTSATHINLKVWSAGSNVLRQVTLTDFHINGGSC